MAEEPGTGSNATNQTAAGEKGRGGVDRDAIVVFGKGAELKAADSAEVVVVIGGSAKVHGKVREAVTVIGGDAEVDGEVGQEVVAVLGSVKVRPGAKIHGDVVAVGGKVDIAEGATVEGHTQEVDFSAFGLPAPRWLRDWFIQCVLKLRPLAPQVAWVWAVAGAFFLVYLLVALLFPRPVAASVEELTGRPATTFLLGLLTMLLLAVVFVILALTVVGMLVVPFILAALFFGAAIGKVAVFESIGFKLTRQFRAETTLRPAGAFLVGFIMVTLLYMIPFLGLLTFLVLSVWGLGGAVTAAFGGLRREIPERPSTPPPGQPEPAMAMAGAGSAAGASSEFHAEASSGANPGPPAATTNSTPPVLPETLAYPKAGFLERMAAGFLDIILVGILAGIAGHSFFGFLGAIFGGPPMGLLITLAYFAGMWTWKGTTVGGIVLGLRVVRADGQPLTFAVALVRALAAAFSVVVLFLGFLWIAWDPEKQGWDDKIAGTAVLKLPRGTPLVCI
jgi:uncharacterized RDD family membrane protein YckC